MKRRNEIYIMLSWAVDGLDRIGPFYRTIIHDWDEDGVPGLSIKFLEISEICRGIPLSKSIVRVDVSLEDVEKMLSSTEDIYSLRDWIRSKFREAIK